MNDNHMQVKVMKGSNGSKTVTVTILGKDGRIYSADPLVIGTSPFDVLVRAALAKAQGREEAASEAAEA